METEAETLESISTTKLKEEVKDLHCSQLDATTNEASIREIQKNEDQHLPPPATVENSIRAETEVAIDKGIVYHVLEGNDGSLESEMFLESPSNANIAIDESYRSSDDCKDKKPMLVKNEQDKVMQLENDAVEAKHHIPETAEIDALGRQNSTATSLNNGGTEYKELAESSELPAEGNNVKDYMVDKLPSLPITSTLVNLSVQEGKLEGGEGEVMEESKQMSGNLFNDKKNPMENVQEDACLVEKSDEQMPEAICASQSIKKEKAVSGSQKDEVEDKSSGEDPLIESGIGQTIGATPDHNHEASLVPAPIKESLINGDRSEEATKNPQMSIDKSMEVVACNGGESLYKNTESIPIEQELRKTNLQEEEIEGKEQDTSSNLLIVEKGPELIIQTEEVENEKKEGDENQQASLSDTCTSTATTSPRIQNGDADNLEDEKSTSNKFEIPSFTTIMEEENSQKAKQEESGILKYASSFTLEAKEDAEKLKEEVSQRHETTNSNEYIDKQIIQEEEVINDQSAVSSGEEIIKCTQEDEEERHDVEVSEGLEVAGTSNDSEAKIMEAEDVEEHSTGKQEDIEEARKPEKEMTMETDTNILSEIHHKTATEDDGTIQQYSKVSDGEGTVKDNAQEDKKKAKDPVEVFEGLETAGPNEDTEQKIVEDGVFTNHSTESIGEQTIKESEVPERLEGTGDETTEEQITDEEVSFIDLSTRSVGEEATNWSSQEDEVFKAHETTSAGEDTGSVTLPDICGDTRAITLPDICAVAVGEVTSNEDWQENEKNAEVHEEVKETNPTHSTQRPSTSIATEASEDIHKKRNEQLVGSSLLVSEDPIEGKSVEKAEITSDKLETESVTLVTEKTSLHQAGQEDMKLRGPSSLPSEEMSAGTTDLKALHVEEVKLVEHTKLDENANDAILTTGEPDANKADDDIKYDMIERACATESESEHHGIEITARETPKDEEEDKLFESSTSASKQPEPEIVEAQENIKDETLMEEKIQGEKEETPTVVQEKEENFTQKEEISKIEETSKKEPEDIGKETAVEELKKQEPVEYKDAHKTVEETCIENFEQETAGEIENTSGVETQEKSIDINKSDKEINDEYAKEDEIQNKSKINISEIVETRDEEVEEQSTEKDGSEVEAKEICINVVSERVDTAASSLVAAKDTSDNIEGAVENLQGFVEEKEGAETSEIDSTRETRHKLEVEDFTNLEVLQQNIKQVDSCEKIQSTEIEISYKHHDESSASTDKPGEEIDECNDPEEAHQVIEASKVSRSEAATCEHEASGSKQTSEMECMKLEKTGDLDLKEEQHYIDTKEVTTSQEKILDKNLCKGETEGVNTEERIRDKDSAAEDIIAVSLANEIAGQSCQEDETEEQQIAEPAPVLRVEHLLHRTSDADDITMSGTQDEEVYEGCKTGDSGESKEKQLKEEICTVKNVSVVSIEEEIIDESSRAENPKEVDTSSNMQVLEGLETVNADEHTEKQIIKKDGAANDKHTVAGGEETVKESFQKDGEIAEKREVECEDSSITHLSEGLQEGRPSEDTSEQMIEEKDDANDNSTVYAGKEEHKDGIHTSDIPNGQETIMENPHKEEEETKEQEGEIKESKLIPEELSFEPTVSAAETITVIEVSEEKQHIDNSEKLKETSSLLSEVSKEQVEEEILQQPDKTNNKLTEMENITLLESELATTDLVDSIDLPSAKMSPDCPANAEASVTTLQALDVEDIKLGETSSITMETEKISLHESEQQTMNLVDASNIPSREMSPGCLANSEASVTTLKALDVEDIKPGETSSITMETENISLHESEQETMNLVNATNIPYGEMGTGCPENAEASATTLQALDVEDIKLTETSSITMETETISLHESEQEITNVDSADLHSGEISPGSPANLEASATSLHALDVEDMKIEETSSIAKVGLHESELGPMDLVYSTDPPSGEMSPGCPGNVEASVTTLQALDVEGMKLKETSLVTMETEKISLHASELENLVDTTDIPFGKIGSGCPANVEASATILQALDVEDMKLEGTSSITKEQEKVSIHGSELEPTNLVDSTDLPSGEMSPGCPTSLEASATTIHALDLEDMKLEETSSIAKVNLHESELEPPNLVDSTDPPFGEMSPVCPGNVEASATILDVECMKLKETSNLNDNAHEEILAAIKPDAAEAEEGLKYNIMLEEASGMVPEDEEQGTEADITTKICSDDEGEETLQDSRTPKQQVLDSIETQEKITDQIPVENETQDEKLEIHSVAQKEEEMPMQQEEKAGKVEEDTKMGSEGRENEYLNEHQNREGETTDKSLELNPEKQILEKEIVKLTQSSEHSKTEGSQPESEKVKSGGEKKFDELAEESESTGTCAYVEKDITGEGRIENMKVENEVVESEVEDHTHEKNEVSNATMKGTMIENPEAVDPTKKLTGTSESDAENQNYATFIETEKIETGEEGNNISISVEDQIVGKNFQEENKKREYLEEAGHKLENEDQSGKINYVLHEDERPEESDKIQKLYTASVNDEAVKEVKATDLVSIKQNFQVIYSSEKTETESPMDEKDWNKSIVSPITKDLDNELPKIEGSSMLETPSVMDATEERSSEEVEQPKNVVASSIDFEEKGLQTVKTTETSEMDDEVKSVNLEERFASVCKLPTFEDENRNQESLTREMLDRDKVEEEIREELVVASDAAPQSEGPVEYVNPESDTVAVGSLTVTAEEPEQKGQQSSKLEYGEQQLEIPVMEMVKDNPMIEDVPQNMKNAEIETTSDQNTEANNSEARELGVFAANEERKGEVPIEGETQDTKVGIPSVLKMIERRFSHTEEECKELKASETGLEYTEKEMQHAEHMKEENLEIAPGLICSKTDSESINAASLLEKEIEKTEELTETTEDSGKETVKVNKATETGLREDEQIQAYKKSIDGVLQEPETVGASAYPGKDVLENSDILENENLEEENSEATSQVEKIGTVESKNTPKNEGDSPNTNALAEETLAREADGECGVATNVEPEKLMEALESVSEAQIHDMQNETKTSQNSEGGTAVKDLDTVSGGDDRIGERIQDKMGDNNVVFEGSAQKPDLKLVGEETSKDDHQEGENGEKFGDGVNPSYPTIEGIGEHIKDEAPVEEILQKETKKKLYEDIVQDGACEGENTIIQIPRQEETEIFLTDERETAERSITARLDELDNTSNMVLEEQSQVKTDFKSGTQVNGNDEKKESTKTEDADNLNENMKDMSHTQPLGKEILDKQDTTKLASVAGIEKSTNTTAEEQTPQEVDFTESTEEEISTGSTNISPMPMEPIEKTLSKAQEKVQKPEQTSEIESEVKEVECGLEESTDEPKPSDLDKASLSDHFQKSIKETLETVGRSGDERESKVNEKSLENKGALNIQVEEEKTDEGEDKPDQEDEEEHKKGDSGSDAPVMVEASRDVEVKPAHKKSHNILSGVGSKVKHSIAKVKKAIIGKSSHHKQSSPKQESESTLTVKAAADPNL